jgi:predicted MFS family arabinose efflux permease
LALAAGSLPVIDRPASPRLRFQLLAFTLTRSVINTGYRMIYPFLPVIARGLNIPLATVALAVTARSTLGIASPFLGSFADVRGRKATMLFGTGLFAAALVLVGVWPTVPGLFLSMILAALGKIIFDPAMQAYLGDRVAYSRRGLAIALTEFGWSGAFIVGVPVAAWLIARGSWSTPFPWFAGLACIGGIVIWRIMPADRAHVGAHPTWISGFRSVLGSPSALAGLAVGVLISSSNEMVNIIFGAWLEDSFGLKVIALGAATAVIGVAELGGESLVAGLVDRLGKRRSVAIGIVLNGLAGMALPSLGRSLPGALAGLFLIYLTFEFTIVSAIPLMTELVPGARATVMAANVGSHSAGRALGALIGPALFTSGLLTNVGVAAGLDFLALVLLLIFVRE